jgi:hypothetical protein
MKIYKASFLFERGRHLINATMIKTKKKVIVYTGGPRKTTDLSYFEISANINGTISHVKFSKRIKNHVIC